MSGQESVFVRTIPFLAFFFADLDLAYRAFCAFGQGPTSFLRRSAYREDRPDWLKINNRTYSKAEGRHELLTRKTGARRG